MIANSVPKGRELAAALQFLKKIDGRLFQSPEFVQTHFWKGDILNRLQLCLFSTLWIVLDLMIGKFCAILRH